MSVAHLLRRDVYPRLDHRKVFGHLKGWDESGPQVVSDCPLCGAVGAFRLEPNRAHGICTAQCGRISWWGMARRVMELDQTASLRWLADRAGLDLGDATEARLEGVDNADRRADLVEAYLEICRAHARANPAGLASFAPPPGADFGLHPGTKEFLTRLKQVGFSKQEAAFISGAGIPQGSLVTVLRAFEGDGLGVFAFERSKGVIVERFAADTVPTPPVSPFRFNEIVGTRSVLLTERAWECLLAQASGLTDVCALVPGASDAAQIQTLLDWRVGTVYLEPDSLRLAERVEQIRASGAGVPFVLAYEAAGGLEGTLATRPGSRLLEGAVHGARWETSRRLARHDLSSDAGRNEAIAEVFVSWKSCDSPLEKDQIVEAFGEATGTPAHKVLDEFQVRQDRQIKASLRVSYRDLFSEADGLASQGRFHELKELLYRKNAEIAGRAFLEKLEPWEPDRFFRSVREMPEGIKTGYPDVDRYIRILPGELVVIGARPSHGKTTFAINLLFNFLNLNRVFRREDPFVFFSFELNEEFLTAKLVSRMTGRHSFYEVLEYLRSGLRTDDAIEQSLGRLRSFGPHLYMVCKPRFTAEDVLAFCQSVWYKHGRLGAIIVDYLQIVGTPNPLPTREQEISYVMRQLRIAGQEFRTPIVALAQAVRSGPDQAQERPGVQHLMDSRVIEQEANTILVLHNPEIQRAQASRNDLVVEDDIVPLEVIVRKNKYGAINRIVQLEYKMRTNEIKNRGGFDQIYEL